VHRAGRKTGEDACSFRLDCQEFTALQGGPRFKFTEAISFVVSAKPKLNDRYWGRRGGGA